MCAQGIGREGLPTYVEATARWEISAAGVRSGPSARSQSGLAESAGSCLATFMLIIMLVSKRMEMVSVLLMPQRTHDGCIRYLLSLVTPVLSPSRAIKEHSTKQQ